jgi:hypothetical protein
MMKVSILGNNLARFAAMHGSEHGTSWTRLDARCLPVLKEAPKADITPTSLPAEF